MCFKCSPESGLLLFQAAFWETPDSAGGQESYRDASGYVDGPDEGNLICDAWDNPFVTPTRKVADILYTSTSLQCSDSGDSEDDTTRSECHSDHGTFQVFSHV